nr:hypothetical protein [uncultured Draconibacterium sp.]
MLKEKIFNALKASILDSKTGKTSISDKSLNAYVDSISAQITEESQITEAIKPHVTVLKEMQANINSVAATAVTEREAALKTEHEAEIKTLKDGKNPDTKGGDDIQALIKAGIEEAVKPLKEKLTGYEEKDKLSQRNTLIASKAKELGIPEWRVKEGFNIADDADEAAITANLTSVKQNLVTAGLEGKNEGAFRLSTPEAQSKELAKSWAQDLPDA